MRRVARFEPRRWPALVAPLALLACGTLIGLDDLEKANCASDCAPELGAGSSAGGNSAGTGVASSGTSTSGGGGGVASGAGGSSTPTSGASNDSGTTGNGGGGSGGTGGGAAAVSACLGGPEPPLAWTEHWYDHNQKLKRVYYDDCIALYFDPDVAPAAQDFLVPFLDDAWTYSLATYGKMGNERIYVVVHQGRFWGGHSSTFIEASHDSHSVIDMGADVWTDGDFDLPAHLLAFLVDSEGAHTKFGAPKAEHYGNEGFPLIYKYDLYLALGLTKTADDALASFNLISNDQPYPDTYWFADWFYPVWRDHGHAKVFASYNRLLQKYYPAGADMWMPTMNYGQYFHFMSGAAGVDLAPLARQAFQWHPDFDDEIAAAKVDFPMIKY